jgi:hypothetical protein
MKESNLPLCSGLSTSSANKAQRVLSAKDTPRRFPPPWTVEDTGACFVVKDHAGQKLAYVYFEGEPGRAQPVVCSLRRRPGVLP